MKKIFTHILLISAAICLASISAFAQSSKDVVLSKVVTGPDPDSGEYLITLEAYATGQSVTTISEDVKPCDIIVILDLSRSMLTNNVSVPKEPQKISDGTQLTVGTTYKVTIDGNEYYLKGFTTQGTETYTARQPTSYTYNGYGNSTYYYKHTDGNYYPVSRETSSGAYYTTYYHLTFTVNETKYYLSGNGATTEKPTSPTRGASTIWTGVLYTRDIQTIYNYRYGTTEPTSATSGSEFYTGTSNYVVGNAPASGVGTVTKIETLGGTGTESVTRLEAVKRASKKFVETVYQNSPATDYHNIAIVGFNEVSKDIVAFNALSSSLVSTCESSIDAIPNLDNETANGLGYYTGGYYKYTNSASGLKRAVEILSANNIKNNGRKKVVVFFTDGVPAPKGTDSFSNVYATSAVNWAYILKQPLTNNISYSYNDSESLGGNTAAANDSYSGTGLGASVYSVAVLGNNEPANARHFLHWVSSNYPNKYFGSTRKSFPTQNTGTGNTEAGEAPHDYYQLSNGSDLTSIFETIAGEASSTGGATTSLGSETTTVVDVLSANFTLPENADFDRIGLYTQTVTGGSSMSNLTWGTRQNLVPAGGKRSDYVGFNDVTTDDGKSTTEIEVTGFDFTLGDDEAADGNGNWVGPRTIKEYGVEKTVYKGKKLVITIPIVTAPGYEGGYDTATNTADSGIKSNGSFVARFDIPSVDFPSIGIVKTGLKQGESAIFEIHLTHEVMRDNDGNIIYNTDGTAKISTDDATDKPMYTIVLTGDDTDTPKYVILKNIEEGEYTVKESSWSWAYTPTPASYEAVQVLCEKAVSDWPAGITETSKCVIFTFSNAEKQNLPDHAESVVVNKFKGTGVTSASSVTTNSKEQPTE